MSASWRRTMDVWFSTHLGIISAAKLEELGCTHRNIAHMVARCELVTMMPGVFRSAQWPCNREQILAAVCARNLAAMIGFTTAGQEWHLRRMLDPLIHVLVPHGRSPEMEGVVVHRCRRIDPVDIVQRPDGIRLTSPPRTLFDSADMIGVEAATSVLEQLLNEQRVTFGTVSDTVQRLYHPNRPGSATMLTVIRSRPSWRAALQSDLEVRVLEEISRQGLPVPVTQFPSAAAGSGSRHCNRLRLAACQTRRRGRSSGVARRRRRFARRQGSRSQVDDHRLDDVAHHRHRRQCWALRSRLRHCPDSRSPHHLCRLGSSRLRWARNMTPSYTHRAQLCCTGAM